MIKSLKDITPYLLDSINNENVSIANAPVHLYVTCEPWHYIRTTQQATLLIDGNPVASMQLKPLEGSLAIPPVFRITTANHFQENQDYELYIDVVEPDGTDTPNRSRSSALIVKTVS